MSIEKLIHTAQGELKPDDPFLTVGTRGFYKARKSYRFIVTEDCIEKNERAGAWVYVKWTSRNGLSETKITSDLPQIHKPTELTVVEKDSPKYFQVKGY